MFFLVNGIAVMKNHCTDIVTINTKKINPLLFCKPTSIPGLDNSADELFVLYTKKKRSKQS